MFICRVVSMGSLLFTVILGGSLLAQEPAAKLPVPSDAAQADALKLAREVYGEEFPQAKTANQKRALAEKLLEKAGESKADHAAHFVLLRLARDIAVRAGEVEVALRAVDEMAVVFQIDVYSMKVEALSKSAKAATVAKQHSAVVDAAMRLIDEAVTKDDFDSAREVGEAALASARKASDTALVRKAIARNKEVQEIAKEYMGVKVEMATLKQRPADPEANLAVGKYLCLTKGDWTRGIPMLALGKAEKLKTIAAQELKGAATSEEQAKLGDAWWGLAEETEGAAQERIQNRARYWYRWALPGLAGLAKDKVEKRLGTTVVAESSRVLVNSLGMRFVLIPAGDFMMGSKSDQTMRYLKQVRSLPADQLVDPLSWYYERVPNETPQRRVRFSAAFYLGVYEVTQNQYQRLMGVNPSAFSKQGARKERIADEDTSNHPVDSVTWNDCVTFCQRLSEVQEEQQAGRSYRLPSEAEWEYACRAGSTTAYSFGDEEERQGDYGWTANNSGKKTHAVGQKLPNAWGLYDMHGNVQEWCSDYYRHSKMPPNVLAAQTGTDRVLRGGSWYMCRLQSRSALRNYCQAEKALAEVGFRVVCVSK